jgi:ribonuclease BN (tRNA processing enzyme)
MYLAVAGAGPAYTDRPDASGAAYLLRSVDSSLLLDLGQGSFPRLMELLDPATLDAVLISHLHPDHFIDLVPLRHYLRWEEPRRRVRVIGPAGLDARLDGLHDQPGFSAASLDIEVLEAGRLLIGPFEVEVGRVMHTESSFGFRVSVVGGGGGRGGVLGEGGQAGLVYSGDCGRAEDLDTLARPGDTLLCEVSFGPGPVAPDAAHLDGPAVGELARRVRAGRVLLTHIQMGFDRAATIDSVRARFDGPVEFVDPGFETTIEA